MGLAVWRFRRRTLQAWQQQRKHLKRTDKNATQSFSFPFLRPNGSTTSNVPRLTGVPV